MGISSKFLWIGNKIKKASSDGNKYDSSFAISSPVDFQVQQWFRLKKWQEMEHQISKPYIIFTSFISITDKLHLDLYIYLESIGREAVINSYWTKVSSSSFGGTGSFHQANDSAKMYYDLKDQTFSRTTGRDVCTRNELIGIGVDPTQFEYWFNYVIGAATGKIDFFHITIYNPILPPSIKI